MNWFGWLLGQKKNDPKQLTQAMDANRAAYIDANRSMLKTIRDDAEVAHEMRVAREALEQNQIPVLLDDVLKGFDRRKRG